MRFLHCVPIEMQNIRIVQGLFKNVEFVGDDMQEISHSLIGVILPLLKKPPLSFLSVPLMCSG
jgi:hypothetical protein